jgi:hypothetical protein
MKPYDKVSSFRGANTLLQGQQNKRGRQKTEDEITGDPRRKAEEPGLLRDTTSEGHSKL